MRALTIIKIEIAFVALCVIIALGTNQCEDKISPQTSTTKEVDKKIELKDSAIKENKIDAIRMMEENDSMRNLDPIIRYRYITVFDSIYYYSSDSCKLSLKTVFNQFAKLDTLSQNRIKKQDSIILKDQKIITDMEDVSVLLKTKIAIKNDTIETITKQLKESKKQIRNAKIKGWLRTAAVAGIGYGAGRLLP